ncbi:acetylornithine transaminase [Paenibacillus sp. HB172176]|uniref:aspartate aminotransferase family protein n=1 Tax=Paenibacillus sp. HB172176 TaxID=2493690 RepID=UPI001F0ED7E3|nr:acetylornithine transaminase [Paenibacillus sp. HB172176]
MKQIVKEPAQEAMQAAPENVLLGAGKKLLFTTKRPSVIMESGTGMYISDTEGREYLDFVGGWAVNALGHSPVALQKALAEQASKLVLASPAYYNKPQLEFAELLTHISGMDKVFFASSGAEANECAVKLARKHGALHLDGACEIITMKQGFHGRTLAMMSATGKPAWKELFEPKAGGFIHVPFHDLDACFAAVTNRTCAIMLELIQGEGGVNEVDEAYLYGLRKICDMYGIALIFDEVQTGLGRTGKLFAYEHYGIKPDILTLGKGIGGGFPLSAMLTTEPFDLFNAGDQGGTHSGQPLAMAAGHAVVGEILRLNLADNAERQGRAILQGLGELANQGLLARPRGRGLLIAFDVSEGSAAPLAEACMRNGLLINVTNPATIRLMPALIVEKAHIEEMLRKLELSLREAIVMAE